MSYNVPTPVQAQTIPILFERRNAIVCAPTGSGKTASYLIPILNHALSNFMCDNSLSVHKIRLSCIILAPTQELIRQILSEAIQLSKNCVTGQIISYLTSNHYVLRWKKAKLDNLDAKKKREVRLSRETKILITTPYRLMKLLSLPLDRCPLDLKNLSYLIVDECDKLLETNLNINKDNEERVQKYRHFRDQLNPILNAIERDTLSSNSSHKFCISLFSATVPDEVANWARVELPQLLNINSIEFIQLCIGVRYSTVSTVKQELRYCASECGKLLEMQYLLKSGLTYPCLIFMESRQRANEILKEILLSDSHILANVISSDKTESQRARIIRSFREGKFHVLICTDLLGRGVDFKSVRMVVNYDLPPSKLEYIHRIGRTGRAGNAGSAITLWTDSDLPNLAGVLKVMKRSGVKVDPDLERLVLGWKQRRLELMKSKVVTTPSGSQLSQRIISRRRGERRLTRKLMKQCDSELKKSEWLRPWNPYRGHIKDLPGSKQRHQVDSRGS